MAFIAGQGRLEASKVLSCEAEQIEQGSSGVDESPFSPTPLWVQAQDGKECLVGRLEVSDRFQGKAAKLVRS